MFVLVGGIVLLAATATALRIGDRSTRASDAGITIAVLTGLALLTVGTWTTLTDTHNAVHWILKVIITLITATISYAALRLLSRRQRQDPSQL